MPVALAPDLEAALKRKLEAALARDGTIVFMTGAGISSASGIPTFRGPEGYWTIGSQVYQPQQLATAAMFARQPWEVWRWYLMRLGVCQRARPNVAHLAVAELERARQTDFALISQNVDGLHGRAGNSPERTYLIHGDISSMRCAKRCSLSLCSVPAALAQRDHAAPLSIAERELLRCQSCAASMRPHVLWFDEYYEEALFRSDTALAHAVRATLLVIVGSSGATTLPARIAAAAVKQGACVVDINPETSPFSAVATRTSGIVLREPATDAVPRLVRWICELQRRPSTKDGVA